MMRLFAVLFLLLTACQYKPTVGVNEAGVVSDKKQALGLLKSGTVIFDTRSTFDFNLNRTSGAINLPPGDFITSQDPMEAAKRLSLWGVTRQTPVVVLGARLEDVTGLAWELAQVGIESVETYNISEIKSLIAREEPAKQNVPLWAPSKDFGVISNKELQTRLKAVAKLWLEPVGLVVKARVSALQSEAATKALRQRVLILETSEPLSAAKSGFLTLRKFDDNFIFGQDFFLKKNQDFDVSLKGFDAVYLKDTSSKSRMRAYVLLKSGARSVFIVR